MEDDFRTDLTGVSFSSSFFDGVKSSSGQSCINPSYTSYKIVGIQSLNLEEIGVKRHK